MYYGKKKIKNFEQLLFRFLIFANMPNPKFSRISANIWKPYCLKKFLLQFTSYKDPRPNKKFAKMIKKRKPLGIIKDKW